MLVHGNRAEQLRDVLCAWLRRYPLAPLENEVILVHSNGIAQWLRLALAEEAEGAGIAAALDFSMPSRFLWNMYRTVLGHGAVPEQSPLDKPRLIWRLVRLLPDLLDQPTYAVLRQFLARDDGLRKRFQLAGRLADLFDQYQVYRADWLAAWMRHEDVWIDGRGRAQALPDEQLWQAALWRALIRDVGGEQTGLPPGRAFVHEAFMAQLSARAPDSRPAGIPRRVLVFGVSAMPRQALEALEALAQWSQILVCVHNPCAHYWADIIPDRDLLRAQHQRQLRRPGMPEGLNDEQMHQYAHPLLASWGKQGRDFIGLLDDIDDPDSRGHYSPAFEALRQRIDLFESLPGASLLEQLQDDICDLRPLSESRKKWPAVDPVKDASIRFHIAHSAQREVEILHDQLLDAFNTDPTLRPRDVIVMVPDIEAYAPHVQAVFGLHDTSDQRFIPYTLADRAQRQADPLMLALEKLLALPHLRLTMGEVMDLLEVSAVRSRFGVHDDDVPRLHGWIREANIRWGLHAGHRASLGLAPTQAAGLQHTWLFGLQRMLLGYALGLDAPAWQGIEPYGEPGGLDAALLGPLSRLLDCLGHHWQVFSEGATPGQWHQRLVALQADFFLASNEQDALTLMRFEQIVQDWHEACDEAALVEVLPISVVAEHCLAQFDQGGLSQRFFAGALTFATLMPMRAIPFRYVCLLGMHDGAYPRAQVSMDFDLMVGRYRPGDRSRRDDDRYLFLEAMLSARDQFYVSWVGRSIQDNAVQPPSVLVAQLRDHLEAGWQLTDQTDGGNTSLVEALTAHHPLQPFSARYFPAVPDAEERSLFTYAREWRARNPDAVKHGLAKAPLGVLRREEPLSLIDLQRFLRNPVRAFFTSRLGVIFDQEDYQSDDLEPYELDALQTWRLREELVQVLVQAQNEGEDAAARIQTDLLRMQNRGDLVAGNLGTLAGLGLYEGMDNLLDHYREVLRRWPDSEVSVLPVHTQTRCSEGYTLELLDQLSGIRCNDLGERVRVVVQARHLVKNKTYRTYALVDAWLAHLAANLMEGGLMTLVLSPQGMVLFEPLEAARAQGMIADVMIAWDLGMREPLPIACRSALAWLRSLGSSVDNEAVIAPDHLAWSSAREAYDLEKAWCPYQSRAYPDFDALIASGAFAHWALRLYRGLADAIKPAEGFLAAIERGES
ncbi:exodeoxyribonuclease V subunit gamma [Alcaligenaceae bacterium CGII-47]|nr:exodeoxyribonuclease V subunit gamma [Alcaligenaceae bacterium CGII-47]